MYATTSCCSSSQALLCVQLKDDKFDMLFHSPLKRADQTAQIIWGNRQGAVTVLPSLREVDLYSFQVAQSSPLNQDINSSYTFAAAMHQAILGRRPLRLRCLQPSCLCALCRDC